MLVSIKRTCELRAPFDLVAENANDWTHFVHIHSKSHKEYRLLFKSPQREIFLYRARILYPLPFFTNYIVFREEAPEREGHQQIYLHIKSGRVIFQRSSTLRNADSTSVVGEYVFDIPSYWRRFPGLFFWIFKWRMRRVMNEDSAVLSERIRTGAKTSPSCAPFIPAFFDLYDDVRTKGIPKPEMYFEDHVFEDLMPAKAR